MANLDRDHYLDKQGLQTLINDLETSIVAEEYSSSTTYALGSYCIYNNLLYRCTTAITTAEAWNSNHWTQIVLADDVELKTSIQAITTAQWEALSPAEQASGSYVITDATTTPLTAEYVPYDNSSSGFAASNVQDAIDELSETLFDYVEDESGDHIFDEDGEPIFGESTSGGGGGASAVTELTDVLLDNPTDNDLLVYDSNLSDGKTWKNAKKIVTCTKSQFDSWSANNSFPYTDCKYIVTDVNNLNTTSADIPYDSTNTASVKDKLDSKQNALSYTTILDESFTSSTTYSYTGKSVTCPIGHTYIVRARCSYSNSAPQEIGASNSSTASDFYRTYARTDKACEIIFVLTEGESAYIWTKYASAASNTIRISVIDIT
jgi:hypothetical protein